MGSKMQKPGKVQQGSYADSEKCAKAHARYYQSTQDAARKGSTWGPEELIMILNKEVDGKPATDRQLAQKLERSMGAIQKKRYELTKGKK